MDKNRLPETLKKLYELNQCKMSRVSTLLTTWDYLLNLVPNYGKLRRRHFEYIFFITGLSKSISAKNNLENLLKVEVLLSHPRDPESKSLGGGTLESVCLTDSPGDSQAALHGNWKSSYEFWNLKAK